MVRINKETKEILSRYSRKLDSSIGSNQVMQETDYSKDYYSFKREMEPEMSRYERWANSLGKLIKINVAEKDRKKIQDQLDTAHLEITASQAITLSIISMILVFSLSALAILSLYLLTGTLSSLGIFLGIFLGLFIFYYTYTMPQRMAMIWRLNASSQMVPAILYIVVYMKHTSNLERAIAFASKHLEGPLALDFKKIFYDVQIGKYNTIKQSLDSYLERWTSYAPEFVESIHLIESSLLESSETRRIQTLEKALQIILDGVYEKMLKFSREIRSPLTNIYMLGIVLPTLGLALLPLASALPIEFLTWQAVLVVFNIMIPFMVFFMTSQVLLKRPGGYGDNSTYTQEEKSALQSKAPWILAGLIALPLLIIGLLPLLSQIDLLQSIGVPKEITFLDMNVFDYRISNGKTNGPISPFSAIISLFVPLSIALFFSITYKAKTKTKIQTLQNTENLEKEFTNSLFQLGNRLGDGIPAEIAFGRVANSSKGMQTQSFFSYVNANMTQSGMSLEDSIFDKKIGAINFFPSPLIATSMRVLIESVKKGLAVAARSLMSISEYVKNINKITARLKDLLAEIVSDMKSNMTFLAPLLSGIVVGLATMITVIISKLDELKTASGDALSGGTFGLGTISDLFSVSGIIPPYFLQIAIGLYIIEIIFILSKTLSTIESGKNEFKEKYDLSRNLSRGIFLYIITALLATGILTALSVIVLQSL